MTSPLTITLIDHAGQRTTHEHVRRLDVTFVAAVSPDRLMLSIVSGPAFTESRVFVDSLADIEAVLEKPVGFA